MYHKLYKWLNGCCTKYLVNQVVTW